MRMRIVRYRGDDRRVRYGVLSEDSEVIRELVGNPYRGYVVGKTLQRLGDVELAAPVQPGKIVCVGLNHASTAAVLGPAPAAQPLLFLKSPNTVTGPDTEIALPPDAAELDVAGEMAVVIGRRARQLTEKNALSYVFGYTCANDVAVRAWMTGHTQWFRAKSSDGFCPLGPWVTQLDRPEDQRITVTVNGQTGQAGSTSDLLWDVSRLLAYITRYATLEQGDVVLTGSPAGLATATVGDTVTVAIDGIGTLTNTVGEWGTERKVA